MHQIYPVKTAIRTAIGITGFSHAAFTASWRWHAPRKNLLTGWNKRHGVLFIHIPKNAGTAIDAMLHMERCPDFHAPASAYRAFAPEFFTTAYKFCVIRNPWDRLVSAYHYMLTSPMQNDKIWRQAYLAGITDFPQFVYALANPVFRAQAMSNFVFRPQWHFITDLHGRIIIDDLIKFESLKNDLIPVASRLGIELSSQRLNTSRRAAYQDYYDEKSKQIIARIYQRDIALFDYEYEQPAAGMK